LERFSFVFLVAGLLFFVLAFVVSGWLPMLSVQDLEVRSMDELTSEQPLEFLELKDQYPEAWKKAFGDKSDTEAFREALVLGHRTYIAEACWHCHSQQIRPWGNDEARYGRRSYPEEYHNVLNMPPLWGTRRIGPDLIRRGGKMSNDWHVAHFYHPPDVSPRSVMPSYPWFYEADGLTPNKTGLSIITYVQWLGSWEPAPNETIHAVGLIDRSYPAPVMQPPGGGAGAAGAPAKDDGTAPAAPEGDVWGEEKKP